VIPCMTLRNAIGGKSRNAWSRRESTPWLHRSQTSPAGRTIWSFPSPSGNGCSRAVKGPSLLRQRRQQPAAMRSCAIVEVGDRAHSQSVARPRAAPEAQNSVPSSSWCFASLAAAFWAIARAARAPGEPRNWHTLSEVGTTSPLPEEGSGYGSRNRRSCPGLIYG
jgi:hypothetical protein